MTLDDYDIIFDEDDQYLTIYDRNIAIDYVFENFLDEDRLTDSNSNSDEIDAQWNRLMPYRHIWTIVESDDGEELIVIAGFRWVNKIDYIFSRKPWGNNDISSKEQIIEMEY